ncbi:MAG TPA: ATP-binding protein [Steroidobacteraceae bacterium]|nr:ATP-binding protein [Steroidobacteraceae bacterium]
MKSGRGERWRCAAPAALAVVPLLALAAVAASGVAIPRAARWLWLGVALLWLTAWMVAAARDRARHLRLIASLLQGLREGDYAARVRAGAGPLGEVWREFNALAAKLGGEERRGLETDGLLSQLLGGLELAVLIVDERDRIVDLNPAAEELLGKSAAELVGRGAADLSLSDWLGCSAPLIDRRAFPSGEGPWEVRRVVFRRHGRPHRLLVVTDVSRALREEERRAWRRLIRVLGHEINNSLGSIQSTAGLLKERAAAADRMAKDGLELIEERSRALGGFIRRYAELARLPPPNPESVEIAALIRRVVLLEPRIAVEIGSDSSETVRVDRSQLEQVLINLVRNAADAALETGGGARVRWRRSTRDVVIEVEDDGPGIAHTENLFVPFFTTKEGGSGVGLVLARQIIEAHGGSLQLGNREGSRGAIAILRVPNGA